MTKRINEKRKEMNKISISNEKTNKNYNNENEK